MPRVKGTQPAEPGKLTPDQLAETYRNTFRTESGAAVLEDLERRFGRRRSFVADPHTTAFHEGQRDVLLMIQSLMRREERQEDRSA